MNVPDLLKTMHTLRYLLPSQVAWRLRYAMERRLPCRSDRYALCGNRSIALRSDFPHVPLPGSHDAHNDLVRKLAAGDLMLLNREYRFGFHRPDWRLGPRSSQRLWTITLHYHEWLYRLAELAESGELEASQAESLFGHYLADWLNTCGLEQPGARDLAWNAYAIATRITWWIRSHQLMSRAFWDRESELEETLLRALWQQAAYLHGHLEYDLLANHILRDAVGLAWAGRFFDAPEARNWLEIATRLAVKQAEEQIFADGGHFERSPMYHKQVMDDLLSLTYVLEDETARGSIGSAWERMAECAAWIRHPDGDIPLLNDATLTASGEPDRMHDTEESPKGAQMQSAARGGKVFPDLGLVVWHGDSWTVFFDVGPIAVDYQPGHGHADSLTLEASFRGHRLWVDPGTWGYDHDDRRRYDRSTAAHNTICVDGRDSSEVWHIFRCGRRAYTTDVHATMNDDGFTACADHNGYSQLPGSPRLSRKVTLQFDRRLVIEDRCDGQGAHRLSGGWLLAPGWTAQPCDRGWRIHRPECGSLNIVIDGPSELRLAQCPRWYHPEFGVELLATRLEWHVLTTLPVQVTTVQEPE